MKRGRWHRAVFVAAGVYNVSWGLYAVADLQWLFRLAGMPPSNTPQIYACLGMVIGLYGVLYLEAGRRPEHGWLPAAIGFAGKVVTNDIIWWLPFAVYLRDAWPHYRATWVWEKQTADATPRWRRRL